MDREVNAAIAELVAGWEGPRHDARFVTAIYRRIGGIHWVDQLERWAMESEEVDRVPVDPREHAFSELPFLANRVTAVFGAGPTLQLAGVRIGSDKIGHFLSQGRKVWLRYQRMRSEREALARSAYTERAIFGQPMTSRYSNADLVANYEGHRFYRSLFEDGVVPGRAAILRWEDGRYRIQRPFSWGDHVTIFWDEALLPNHYDDLAYPHVRAMLLTLCDGYREAPEAWAAPGWDALWARYGELLQLRDTRELRLDLLCEGAAPRQN